MNNESLTATSGSAGAGTRTAHVAAGRVLSEATFTPDLVLASIGEEMRWWQLSRGLRREELRAAGEFLGVAARQVASGDGRTVQQWWDVLEAGPLEWDWDGRGPNGQRCATRALTMGRVVRPSWKLLQLVQLELWVRVLPADDPLVQARDQLHHAMELEPWPNECGRRRGANAGLRVMVARGYDRLEQITEDDLLTIPRGLKGQDTLDVGLCRLGVLSRTPRRGGSRRLARPPRTVQELVDASIPAPFRAVTAAYLTAYQDRVSPVYATTTGKVAALSRFWQYLQEVHPEVTEPRLVLPRHARGFAGWGLEKARTLQRNTDRKGTEDRTTSFDWLGIVHSFFVDVCHWAAEPGSEFAQWAPSALPLTSHDVRTSGYRAARVRTSSRMTSTVMDLAREIPNIRAFALRRWTEASETFRHQPGPAAAHEERQSFWDWAILELLLTTGLRVEEAGQLTTLDILKRELPNGQLYYLLHVKPSKFDRARVIPIGDGLGNVIAEIISHVKTFYGTNRVPDCDRRENSSKLALPRAPYLLQGVHHPSAVGVATVRSRLTELSLAAGATHADGRPLRLQPHDCRRVFATEHLNSNTPVHVIAALLGHAGLDTVMIYAKLYPDTLVEGYRAAMRGLYSDVYGTPTLPQPSTTEWDTFTASCNLRDMGTHVCALPTGEHCSRGRVCLGCTHAQPKKSAAPTFRRMIASHTRSLTKARDSGEPAGQIAARELEIGRLKAALARADELSSDAAHALEAAV